MVVKFYSSQESLHDYNFTGLPLDIIGCCSIQAWSHHHFKILSTTPLGSSKFFISWSALIPLKLLMNTIGTITFPKILVVGWRDDVLICFSYRIFWNILPIFLSHCTANSVWLVWPVSSWGVLLFSYHFFLLCRPNSYWEWGFSTEDNLIFPY